MVALSHLFTYFNSRPHGGRLFYRKLALRPHYFNSRPHGGRRGTARNVPQNSAFQLTPSRRATHIIYCKLRMFKISTHALTEGDAYKDAQKFVIMISTHALTEGDSQSRTRELSRIYFNSRPHGGRLSITGDSITSTSFQLTPSRRATRI